MQLHPSITNAGASEAPAYETHAAVRGSHRRRRLGWAAAIFAVVLLLVFVPPLINANRYRRQIARTMSASLGRPVHLDTVRLHLLPVPGLTLTNFVVSEDPKFGSEPTIRADTVEATLRFGSLWRHPVEFSTVRFLEPHVNLVRNAEGRWNLADVLLHASHVDTAPTAQTHAGPAPRFPYIEATGGRVNVKLGDEKLPFAITDADFALWLPSPKQWRVRLEGQPARTDTNLNDPGIVRLEGSLQQAETATGIPVDFHASWHDAPLGEATRLLTGDDQGWRGTVNVDSTIAGTLNEAHLGSKFTLGRLRRAEFAAVQPLDLQMTCEARLQAAAATLRQVRCAMPDSGPTPLRLEAETMDLNRPQETGLAITAEEIPLHWGLLWAALFSARVPTDRFPAGRIDVHLQHRAGTQTPERDVLLTKPARRTRRAGQAMNSQDDLASLQVGSWSGEVRVQLPSAPQARSAAEMTPLSPSEANVYPNTLVWRLFFGIPGPGIPGPGVPKIGTAAPAPPSPGWAFVLQPVSLPLGKGEALSVTSAITSAGYTVSADGSADAAALLLPSRYLPQLGDGLESVLPYPPTGSEPVRLEFTCSHPWGALQTCTNLRPSTAGSRAAQHSSLSSTAAQAPPSLPSIQTPQGLAPQRLAPRSLSPYDLHPPLGSTPSSGSAVPGSAVPNALPPATNSPFLNKSPHL